MYQQTHQINNNTIIFSEIVRKATIDPDWFCSDVLNVPNDPWQSELMNAVADLDRARLGLDTLFNHDLLSRFTCRAFHGPGKTHFMAKLIHWWNFTRKGRIPCTAPKEKQLTTRLWPEFRKILGKAIEEYKSLVKVDKTLMTWCNDPDWCALAETAANPDNIAGYHDDWLMFLVEEASGVSEEFFPVIEGALSTPGAILVMIGNPTRTQGEFYNSHMKPGTKELYYKKAIRHDETPRISKKWVDGMIAKYGIDSPVVQVRVFGNFVDTEENQLIALAWLQTAIDREFVSDGSIPKIRVSVDVADGGEDSSIVSVGFHYETFLHLTKQYKYNFPAAVAPIKTAQAAARIFDALVEKHPDSDADLVVDGIGVGAGTAGWLIEAGYPVVRYIGGGASDDPTLYRNRRTQSYLCYRDDLRDEAIIIEDDYCDNEDWDDFLAQHASIKSKPGTERIEDLETKKEMKSRGIKSPDMPDGIKMHYATATPIIKGMFDILTAFPNQGAVSAW